MVTSREREVGNNDIRNQEIQTTMYKISYMDVLYNIEYSQYFIITINGV